MHLRPPPRTATDDATEPTAGQHGPRSGCWHHRRRSDSAMDGPGAVRLNGWDEGGPVPAADDRGAAVAPDAARGGGHRRGQRRRPDVGRRRPPDRAGAGRVHGGHRRWAGRHGHAGRRPIQDGRGRGAARGAVARCHQLRLHRARGSCAPRHRIVRLHRHAALGHAARRRAAGRPRPAGRVRRGPLVRGSAPCAPGRPVPGDVLDVGSGHARRGLRQAADRPRDRGRPGRHPPGSRQPRGGGRQPPSSRRLC